MKFKVDLGLYTCTEKPVEWKIFAYNFEIQSWYQNN